jgi:hypothetical protein
MARTVVSGSGGFAVKTKCVALLAMTCLAGAGVLSISCGSSAGDLMSTAPTPDVGSPEAASIGAVDPNKLQDMLPSDTDLPGFVLSEARFLDNEAVCGQASDPASCTALFDSMGRVTGLHAVFVRVEGAPPDAPDGILLSLNLFEQPSGALEFIDQPLEAADGTAYEPVDVGSLGPHAVGFSFQASVPGAASGYGIAFARGRKARRTTH